MRTVLAWILILHALHLPIPFPDLDGECRGTPICSLFELDAWHVLMLGVKPNDDIDRGPIRRTGDDPNEVPTETPFGDTAVLATVSAAHSLEMIGLPHDSLFVIWTSEGQNDDFIRLLSSKRQRPLAVPIARTACICFCSWLV